MDSEHASCYMCTVNQHWLLGYGHIPEGVNPPSQRALVKMPLLSKCGWYTFEGCRDH